MEFIPKQPDNQEFSTNPESLASSNIHDLDSHTHISYIAKKTPIPSDLLSFEVVDDGLSGNNVRMLSPDGISNNIEGLFLEIPNKPSERDLATFAAKRWSA